MTEKTDLVAGGSDGEVVWERWQKKRVFVRALEGTYGGAIVIRGSMPVSMWACTSSASENPSGPFSEKQ